MPDVALSGAVSRYAADDAEFQLFVLLQSPSVRLCIERVWRLDPVMFCSTLHSQYVIAVMSSLLWLCRHGTL